ncbi:purine catabolism regulatory protein [Blastococcus sp. DSM 46786]|uniref:PucR family transcriptional regulator n=1 Tax=Blastococcus sp. DSM 46786 TaxID=1798227 RepID=UPI0008C83A3F|nr:PucR family transcriptional regulator [Blastococcus sp. DSM 46786]SEL66459.1 purine catabolism regulatory protein [Blastococcus sp. DSM 46786]
MTVSLARVLQLPVLQAGRPVVLTGEGALDRPVRWVHVSELPDIAPLLRGGELILTTGVALPDSPVELREFVATLASAGACALVMELGRRFTEVPPSVVAAGARHGLPVVALRRTVRFVAVTEEVHGLIVDEQNQLLRFAERAHREFGRLSVEAASVQQIVDKAHEIAGDDVVLEDLAHRAVAYGCDAGRAGALLEDWERRSRGVPATDSTATAGPEGWLVTPVGPRGQRWGRLAVPAPTRPEAQLVLLLERAAEALAINRLVERDRAGLVRQAHRGLLDELLLSRTGNDHEMQARAAALGFPTSGHRFVGLAVHSGATEDLDPVTAEGRDRALAEEVTLAARDCALDALVATTDGGRAHGLLAIPTGRPVEQALDRLAERITTRLAAHAGVAAPTIGVGWQAEQLPDAAPSLTEAMHAVAIGAALRVTRPRPYYRLADVRLRGLLALLQDDPRVLGFAEAELGRLLDHDSRHGTDLVHTLRQYFTAGANKASLARAMSMSRPALYARLNTIERLLTVDLDDPESRLTLHLALLVRDVAQGAATAARPRPSGRPQRPAAAARRR